MINYRLSLLIIICLSYWSCPNHSMANPESLKPSEITRNIDKIAQGISPDSSKSSSEAPVSDYDQFMQAGYQATREKNYQAAQEHFQKALEARPKDIYAQQALQNVEFYLTQKTNSLTNLTNNGMVLWIGLFIIIMVIGAGFLFLMRRFSTSPQKNLNQPLLTKNNSNQPEKERENIKEYNTYKLEENKPKIEIENESETEVETSLFNETISTENDGEKPEEIPEVMIESSKDENVLLVQTTTRIPSGDFIERLLEQLHETDPKKRREAVWKLAQTADSRAMKPLVDLMIDTDSQERSLILEALSQISTRTLKPMNHALTISLQDKNPQVRKNAIRDLTRIYELMSQISQLLCHAIDDSDREVQDTAKWAINQLNTQIPPSVNILNRDGNPEVTVEESYSDTME
jgi:hypothetical protein